MKGLYYKEGLGIIENQGMWRGIVVASTKRDLVNVECDLTSDISVEDEKGLFHYLEGNGNRFNMMSFISSKLSGYIKRNYPHLEIEEEDDELTVYQGLVGEVYYVVEG